MSGDELKVDPGDLDKKATQIEGIPWGNNPGDAALSAPDALGATTTSVANLRKNAQALGAEQQWGVAESRRLAETLRLVGKAYRTVDETSAGTIDSTIPGGSGRQAPAPVPIGTNTVPAPPAPAPMAPFENVQALREVLDPIEADNKLAEGDQGASLRTAAGEWATTAATLSEAAIPFDVRVQDWEGVAAEAAYTKLKSFGGWLKALAGKYTQLAAEAEKLAQAHDQAKTANSPVRVEYESLQTQIMNGGGLASPQTPALQARMTELYQESEGIRASYASGGQPTAVQPPQPRPNSIAPTSPVTANGDPRAKGVPAQTEEEAARGQTGGAQSGGGQPAGGGGGAQQPGAGQGQPQVPQEPPVSPASATDPAASAAQQAAQQGGQQGGGSPGGGQPGGGQPGGGSPGGGSPGGPGKGMPNPGKGFDPKLPTDPTLKPAAAGGGSGGGGGGGGGVPAMPLQPAVGAETVAPTPMGPGGAAPAAAAAGPGSGGAAGGGMGGGMAPMGHGAQGGSGEKKRNPALAEDEPLYVEDRPWTEWVIGNRTRRRGGALDDTKKGDTQ